MRGDYGKVSLPGFLHKEIEQRAGDNGRSLAKQIEHSYRIACAVEKLLPIDMVQAIKQDSAPAADTLLALAKCFASNPEGMGAKKHRPLSSPVEGS